LQSEEYIGRRYGGSGLGLFIAKELIELAGGKVTVQAQLGVGTVFKWSAAQSYLKKLPQFSHFSFLNKKLPLSFIL